MAGTETSVFLCCYSLSYRVAVLTKLSLAVISEDKLSIRVEPETPHPNDPRESASPALSQFLPCFAAS